MSVTKRSVEKTGVSDEPVVIEFGGLENLSEIMPIMVCAFPETYGESWNNIQCRSMLMLPGTKLLLARIGEEYCGFAISRTVLNEEELLMIAVDPDARKMGVGSSLLQRLTERAESNCVEVIFLEVRSNNSAQSLYKSHGFEQIGVRAGYYTGANNVKYDANTYRKILRNKD